MKPGELAESIIDGFAIRDPKDIDVEAISIDAGMQVRFRRLDGCSATLLGVGDRAIATISPSGNRGRDRFSIGHELGHWSLHRGQSFYCRAEIFGNYTKAADKLKEKQADEFSSRLLMPTSLLRPKIGKLRALSLNDLRALAADFSTSDAAMAFRTTLLDNFPVILCCYSAERREWFLPAPMVSSRWRPKEKLDKDTFAHDFVRGNTASGSGKQSAEAWFENSDADKYEIREECVPYRQGQVLVLLYLPDEMLDAPIDWDDWRTRYRKRT